MSSCLRTATSKVGSFAISEKVVVMSKSMVKLCSIIFALPGLFVLPPYYRGLE